MRSRPATSFRGIEELKASYLPFDEEFAMDMKRISFQKRYVTCLVPEGKEAIGPPSAELLESLALEIPGPPEAPIQPAPNPHPQPTTNLFFWKIVRGIVGGFMVALERPVYHMTPKVFRRASLPPKGRYVVLGIFDDSGILMDEVIVYMEGQAISRQLVEERRKLFSLPILRDIKAFKLYKVSLLPTC